MNLTFITRLFPDLPSRCFAGILLLYGIIISLTVQDYGINPDEESHITYGQTVINWYVSGFEDRRIFSATNTWLYGGFFDTVTYLTTQILPFDKFNTRHLCTSIMGLLGVIAAYKIGCLFGSKWTGVLAALFLILTPRYYGHAFNNHKDIPFAVLYLWSVYWQLKILRAMPTAPWTWIIAMGGITGLAMGIRVGGVMLLCFAGAFWFLKSAKTNPKRCILQWCTAFGVAYIVMLLFWPWAQTNPFIHPLKALLEFSKFSHVSTDMLFGGQYLGIHEIPWYYAPKWLLWTLPEFVLIGLIAGLVITLRQWRSTVPNQALTVGLLITSGLAPLLYIMWSQTPLYDGVRHILFAILPLIVLSALGIYALCQRTERARVITLCVVGLSMVTTLWEMIALHPNQYVYFNHLFAQGVEHAHKKYPTDYWNNSFRQGAKWLSAHATTAPDRKIKVHSFPASTRFFLDADRFEMVENPWTADYLLVSTRYDHHRVIPGEVKHIVKAHAVPLLYIMRPDETFKQDPLFSDSSAHRLLYLGVLYRINGQNENAIHAFEQGLQLDPEHTALHIELGEQRLALDQPAEALAHFQKANAHMSNNPRLTFKMGQCHERLKNTDEAKAYYKHTIALHPYYNLAYRALGDLLRQEQQYREALDNYRKIVDVFPESLGDWHRIGLTYNQLGDYHNAAIAWQNLASQDPSEVEIWLNIALMLFKQDKMDEALEIYGQVRSSDPDNQKALYMTSVILLKQQQWDQTIDILREHVQQDATATDAWLLLAQAYRQKGELTPAQHALAKYIMVHQYRHDGWLEYFELGKRYHVIGDLENAKVIYTAAAKMLPDNQEIQDSLRVLSTFQK